MFRGLFLVVLLATVTIRASEDERPRAIERALDEAHNRGGGFSAGGGRIAGAVRVIRFGGGRGSVSVGGSTNTRGENPSVHVGVRSRF